jgi:hypothetical protein
VEFDKNEWDGVEDLCEPSNGLIKDPKMGQILNKQKKLSKSMGPKCEQFCFLVLPSQRGKNGPKLSIKNANLFVRIAKFIQSNSNFSGKQGSKIVRILGSVI